MGKFFTRKNIGLALAVLVGLFLTMSAAGKLFGSAETLESEMHMGQIISWAKIIGIGELASVILFIIPKTMKLGTVLLSAYFGGAIMFHMAHTNPDNTSFMAPAIFLILVWLISWVRGNELIDLKGEKA